MQLSAAGIQNALSKVCKNLDSLRLSFETTLHSTIQTGFHEIAFDKAPNSG